MTVRIGPVKATPYLWPYDGSVPVERTALLCIGQCPCGRILVRGEPGWEIVSDEAGSRVTARSASVKIAGSKPGSWSATA